MQLLNPAMDAEEIKTAGLSKYAFIRTYVQVCSGHKLILYVRTLIGWMV